MSKLHLFEGELRTVKEIGLLVPALGENGIRRALADGRNTRIAMMAYDPKAAAIAATRKAYAKLGKPAMFSQGSRS